MLTNLLNLENNLSVRDVHKEEKSSKSSTPQESRVKDVRAKIF